MDQYQIWQNKNGRFYEIYFHRDLFNWVINLSWGSVRKKPRSKTLAFVSYDDAKEEFEYQVKRRKSRKYFLTGHNNEGE